MAIEAMAERFAISAMVANRSIESGGAAAEQMERRVAPQPIQDVSETALMIAV